MRTALTNQVPLDFQAISVLLRVDGEEPLNAWRRIVQTVFEQGQARSGIRELLHLSLVIANPRPLSTLEISKYKKQVGSEPWERASKIYTRGSSIPWKPSYIGRLTQWREHSKEIDQLEQIKKKALRFPGSKTLCACVFRAPDLSRFIAASVPCVLCLDFKIRDGAVHLGVFFRSQDVYRLFLADYHYLAMIQRELTDFLGASSSPPVRSFRNGNLIFHLCSAHFQAKLGGVVRGWQKESQN